MLKFLPPTSGRGGISEEGKRILLLFVALNVGTSQEDTELLNFTCKEAQADVVTEEAGDSGAKVTFTSARKWRRTEIDDARQAGVVPTVQSLASSMERGLEHLLAFLAPLGSHEASASNPTTDISAANSELGCDLVTARQFEEVLEMFEGATKKSEESHGAVKAYWDKLVFRLPRKLDNTS
jgi:hypothetical protein